MDETRIKYLLEQYQNDQLTQVERNELLKITMSGNTALLKSELIASIAADAQFPELEDQKVIDSSFRKIMSFDKSAADSRSAVITTLTPVHRVHLLKRTWFRYTAVALLIAGSLTFLHRSSRQLQQEIAGNQPLQQSGIHPGGNKAILTLADGSSIVLDSAAVGDLAKQGGTRILKLNSGALAYEEGMTGEDVMYNTISTPKGGQYQIILPDGSQVWLNSASSLKFPTVFTKNRKVTLSGEAYFEVNKDNSRPFIVTASNTEIVVLGTSFNINAYSDEKSTITTLLNGAVKVTSASQSRLLAAGQEATTTITGEININKADTDQATAWKNGLFHFNRSDIKSVMRQFARWYNIEVVYEGEVSSEEFSGKLPRDADIKQLVRILEKNQVHFKIDGKKITVLP